MPQGPLFAFRGPSPEDPLIRSVTEELLSLRSFAERLISRSLVPLFEAGDLIDECFLRAVPKLAELSHLDSSHRLEWLRRHLRQIARDRRRARKREKERLLAKAHSLDLVTPEDSEPRGWLGPMLRGLDRKDALLVVQVCIKGCSLRDAAKKIGLSCSEASRRLHEVKDQVRRSLQ